MIKLTNQYELKSMKNINCSCGTGIAGIMQHSGNKASTGTKSFCHCCRGHFSYAIL